MYTTKSNKNNIQYYYSSNNKGIGIDVETRRLVHPKLYRFYNNKFDQYMTNRDILLEWTIKEACFKAVSNYGFEVKLLNEIVCDFQNHLFYFSNKKGFFRIIQDDCLIKVIAELN
tara:strand:- start:208 stop:552 length:345 start_codon:yes stop_codon:yes gene_type:complete